MRVLMTTDTVGGVWTYTTSLIAELLRKKVAVALITIGGGPSAAQAEWLRQTADAWGTGFRWEVSHAPLEWMTDNILAYSGAESLLLRVAREFSADLLHSNQFCFGALPLECPKLVVAHSDVLSWASACRSTPLESCEWLEQYCALVSSGLCAADAVVAPTHWMLASLGANFLLPPTSAVIANGRTLPAMQERPERRLQAVSAGRFWDEGKNLAILADVQMPLPILVAGETAYESKSLPVVRAGIQLLGKLEEAELLHLFRQSSIYLCTSKYEPFGLAPLEAALCGCAVLAHDIPALREVWNDGALYFHNAFSLSAQLARLSRHPDELLAARRRSRNRAVEYTAAGMAEKYITFYRALRARSGSAAHVA